MLDHQYIKKLAADAGFDLCGLAPCRHLVENESMLRAWLGKGYQSSLAYMERNVEKRADPRKLVEGARTAVVCAVSYKNRAGEGYPPGHRTKVASYACAADYHTTIKGMLGRMLDALCASRPDLSGRAFVDTAPLLEKQLAVEAGLGWIGRQSLLVTPRFGTYVLLGELLLTDDADAYDPPFEGSRCGRCHNCIESCPTGAIVAPKVIDTGRCISCHTIEKEPTEGIGLDGWIFGCDRCQSCCPHNQKAPMHTNPAFDPVFDPLAMDAEAWLAMDETEFEARMGTTPLTRSGLARIRSNIAGTPRPRITRPRIRRTDAPRFRSNNNPGIRHDFHILLRANPRPGRKCKTRPGTNAGHRGFLPARNNKPIPQGGGIFRTKKSGFSRTRFISALTPFTWKVRPGQPWHSRQPGRRSPA